MPLALLRCACSHCPACAALANQCVSRPLAERGTTVRRPAWRQRASAA